jgi:CRP/FNR family transcriptional regulator, anaerobic regulatory protein
MTELEKYIHTYFGVNKEDATKISSFFKLVSLKKGDYFLKAGRQSDRLGFVQSGIVREFVFVGDKEVTKWISTKGYFVVDLSSFVFLQPARWNFQAFTDSELFPAKLLKKSFNKNLEKGMQNWLELLKRESEK